jgi:D-alanine-D-alanine ligase
MPIQLNNLARRKRSARNMPPVLLVYNLDRTWPPHDIHEAVTETEKLGRAMRRQGHSVTVIQVCDADLPLRLKPYDPDDWIVFNWCEGLPGVDHSEAVAARMIADMGFVYTGATPEALSANWHKQQIKTLLQHAGVATPHWQIYENTSADNWDCFPAIVKLANEHCSLGVTTESVVFNRKELKQRIRYVLEKFKQPALVEDFIDGREFHVSLWGNDNITMLPPVEMDFSALKNIQDRLCTHGAKFDPNSLHYRKIITRFKAKLSATEYNDLEKTAVQAYRTSGCRDYARIDIRLRDGIFYVLDTNANTDLTSEASTACAAANAGYSYGAIGSRIVRLAAERHPLFGNGKLSLGF